MMQAYPRLIRLLTFFDLTLSCIVACTQEGVPPQVLSESSNYVFNDTIIQRKSVVNREETLQVVILFCFCSTGRLCLSL
jgi:hypothetical protein